MDGKTSPQQWKSTYPGVLAGSSGACDTGTGYATEHSRIKGRVLSVAISVDEERQRNRFLAALSSALDTSGHQIRSDGDALASPRAESLSGADWPVSTPGPGRSPRAVDVVQTDQDMLVGEEMVMAGLRFRGGAEKSRATYIFNTCV